MEENKYYTPEIDEFYVGFEFEDSYGDEEYAKNSIDKLNIEDVISSFLDKEVDIRVKHLDKQDLIELGFNPDPSCERYYEFNEYQLYVDIHPDFNITIYNDDPIIIFQGSIKNKSELIKVLKMLGIK